MTNKGWMYDYINGKSNQEAFTPDQLPKTRLEMFKDVFKTRFGMLIGLSLLMFVFILPAFAWLLVTSAFIHYLPPELVSASATILAQREFGLNIVMYSVLIPLLCIAFLGIEGALFVERKLVWGQGVFFFRDFFEGIKEGWRASVVSGFLNGVVLCCLMGEFYFFKMNAEIPFFIQSILLIGMSINILIAASSSLFLLTASPIYQFKFGKSLKNSLLFGFILLPKTIIFMSLSLILPLIAFLFPVVIIQIIALAIFAIIGLATMGLIWTLYSHSVFDQFINRSWQKDIVNKGLMVPTDKKV